MPHLTHEEWITDLVLTRDLPTPGDRSAFFTRNRRGEYTQVVRGAYLPIPLWRELDADSRHLALIHATAAVASPGLFFSHQSAAALWRLPAVGEWPDRAHVVAPLSTT